MGRLIRRAAIEVAFKKKEDSERRALKIVEHIVESLTVDIQWLTDNVYAFYEHMKL